MTKKKKGRDVQAYTLRLDADLHRRLKIQSAVEGKTMHDIIEGLVRSYLKRKGVKES